MTDQQPWGYTEAGVIEVTETLAGTFPCPQCDRVFNSPQALQGHVMHHSKKKPERVPCPECGNEFYAGTGMSQHRKARHGVGKAKAPKVTTKDIQAAVAAKKKRRNHIDLDWTTDDVFQTVITSLWPDGHVPVTAVLPLIQWRETTREFLEKVQSE